MGQNPSWEPNSSSASQEISCIEWNQSSLPHSQVFAASPCPEPDQSSPSPHPASWRSILILSSHLFLGLLSNLFISGSSIKTLCASLLSPLHASYPAPLVLLDLITQIVFSEDYISWSSSLCSLLHAPVAHSLLRTRCLPQHPILEQRQPMLLPHCVRPALTPTQNNSRIIFLYVLIFVHLDSELEDKRICNEW